MKGYYFFHGRTNQWLNHNSKTFYRGERGIESEWIVNQAQTCTFTLVHVLTGVTYRNFTMVKILDDKYQLLLQIQGRQEQIAIDTDATLFPQSDSVIFWEQLNEDNKEIINQVWQVVLDVGNIQLYNKLTNSYMLSDGTNYYITNNATDINTVWSISNNVLHHLTSNIVYNTIDYDFITPIDFTIIFNKKFILSSKDYNGNAGIKHVNGNLSSDEIWTMVPTKLNPIANDVKLLTNISILSLNVEAYEEATPDEISSRILATSNPDVICLQEDRLTQTMYIAGYKKVTYCLAEKGIPCDEERKTGCISGIEGKKEYLINSVYVKLELIVSGFVKVDDSIDITDQCAVPRCASIVNIGPIKIANTHICGGRFDDINFKEFYNVKSNEITNVIKHNPTIIVGDFNGGYDPEIAKHVLSGYDIYQELTPKDKQIFLRYYSSAHTTLNKFGYASAYTEIEIGKTSIYGGVPDWIYYLPKYLLPTEFYSIDYMDYGGKKLTDHNAVYVNFSIHDTIEF